MPIQVHLDYELRSRVALDKTNVSIYAAHPTTEPFCCKFSINEGPLDLWVPGDPFPFPRGEPLVFHAWNAEFEYTIWNVICHTRYGWPKLDPKFLYCTQAQACYYGYPRSLDKAAKCFGVEKDMEGHELMLKLSKPEGAKLRGCVYEGGEFLSPSADELQRLYEYCGQDVYAERFIAGSLPPLPKLVRDYYLANLKMNQTGVPVDVEFCMSAHSLFQDEIKKATKRLSEMTAHLPRKEQVTKPTQCKRMLKFLASEGIILEKEGVDKKTGKKVMKPSMSKEIVEANLDKHEMIRIRYLCKSAAPHKYDAVLRHVSPDGRCRNAYMFYGAHTGRAVGTGVQFHNFKKNRKKPDTRIIEAITGHDFDTLDLIYNGEVSQALADYVRSLIIPAPDQKLNIPDFSQVEARITFWLAREEADFSIIYEAMAADVFGIDVATIGKESDERQLGKAIILGAGFGMGFRKFVAQALNYGVVITEDFAKVAIDVFRAKYPKIVAMWRSLMRAFEMAYFRREEIFYDERVQFGWEDRDNTVWIRLPSGRQLFYRKVVREKVEGKPTFFYTGPRGRKKVISTIIIENIVQAIAYDIFMHGIIDLQTRSHEVILQTHDEVGITCPFDTKTRDIQAIMTAPRTWTKGLDIKVGIEEKSRYYGGNIL